MAQRLVFAALLVVLLSVTAGVNRVGAVVFEGFEAGIPGGWTLSGVGGTSGATANIAPTQGGAFAFIDTTGSVPTGFTGVGGATEGSTLLSPAFTIPLASTLSLDLNFLTNDGAAFTDFALVQLLTGGGGPAVATLYTANTTGAAQAVPAVGGPGGVSPGVTLTPATAGFDGIATGPVGGITYGPIGYGGAPGGSTGWVTSSFDAPPGEYQLWFVVSDFGDAGIDSALGIDNINVVAATPEPGTLLLLGSGLAGLGAGGWWKRRKTDARNVRGPDGTRDGR